MSSLDKLDDWRATEYDFAFLAANRELWFRWQDAHAGPSATDARVLAAIGMLRALWSPTTFRILIDSFADGMPAQEDIAVVVESTGEPLEPSLDRLARRVEDAVRPGSDCERDARRAISSLGPTLEGWARLAVPESARIVQPWYLACDDGFLPQPYQSRDGSRVDGQRTIWLQLTEASAASDLSVFVRSLGDVEARLTLGASVFRPAHDPRSSDTRIHGAPLHEWQAANASLLERVIAEMTTAGFQYRQD